MKSWKLTRIAGIDVSVHWTFLLLLGWIVLRTISSGGTLAILANHLLLIIAVFACVVLHELGHALAARQFGIGTRGITLLPIGGVARLERMPREPFQELWIALAGPLVNVVIAGVLLFAISLTSMAAPFSIAALSTLGFLQQLFWINVGLVLFNLLPAFPMDGGRVLRALLAMIMSYQNATQNAASVGKVMAILLGTLGLFVNPMLVLVAVFVFFAGAAEARMVESDIHAEIPTKWVDSDASFRPTASTTILVIDDQGNREWISCPPSDRTPFEYVRS